MFRGPDSYDGHDEIVEALAVFEAFCESAMISWKMPELTSDRYDNITAIKVFFNKVYGYYEEKLTKLNHSDAKEKYRMKFGVAFAYEFTDGDLERIQTLVNELRDYLTKSEAYDAKHKERVLKRLEALQSEMHKKVSSLDKFWGLIGDGGVAIGKAGKDAKPFVDRIKEITQIVWRTQARAEELPSGTTIPLLTENTDPE